MSGLGNDGLRQCFYRNLGDGKSRWHHWADGEAAAEKERVGKSRVSQVCLIGWIEADVRMGVESRVGKVTLVVVALNIVYW